MEESERMFENCGEYHREMAKVNDGLEGSEVGQAVKMVKKEKNTPGMPIKRNQRWKVGRDVGR